MVTNYYSPSNNYQKPIRREPKPYLEVPKKCEEHPTFEHSFDNDKILLLGLLAVLFLTDCNDIWLMLALLYLAFG